VQIELVTEAPNPNWFKRLRRARRPFVATLRDRVPVDHAKSNKKGCLELKASQFDRERYDTGAHNSLGRPRIELGAERERLLQVFDEDPHFGRRPAACRSNRKDWHSPFIRS
jgi:hypothetical protein